jgi:hypothetical protein
MGRLDTWKFALASTVTFTALSVVCALAFTFAPDATVAVFSAWMHGLDLKLLIPPGGKPVTPGQVVFGATSAAVVSFVGGAILAGCYNLFGRHSE